MAKAKLGTKRVCPETERKFYDLNNDPIVSPYTGKNYPLSFFETPEDNLVEKETSDETNATETAETSVPELDGDAVELVSLEDADNEESGATGEEIPDLGDDDDVDIGEPADDTFLETDDDDNDDVSDLIIVSDDGDDS